MRENLVTLGLAFFITCTGVLFWKNRALVKEYEQGQLRLQSVLNNVQQSNPTWIRNGKSKREVETESRNGKSKREVETGS
jgi:hypothetical protein